MANKTFMPPYIAQVCYREGEPILSTVTFRETREGMFYAEAAHDLTPVEHSVCTFEQAQTIYTNLMSNGFVLPGVA
jgi:hypothetical protein